MNQIINNQSHCNKCHNNKCEQGYSKFCTNFGGFAYPIPDSKKEFRDLQNRIRQININDGSISVVPPTVPINNEPQPVQDVAELLFIMINAYRVENGLLPLAIDPLATQLAQNHSLEMAKAGQINHEGFLERVTAIQQQYPNALVSENVASFCGTGSAAFVAENIFNLWINSQLHRANILGDFTLTGIGVDAVSNVTFGACYYATQIFIKP